jgi:MFS family permease
MLVADAVRALLITSLLLLTLPIPERSAKDSTVVWPLVTTYAIVFLASSTAQFFAPARLRLVGDVVNESEQPRASALLQLTSTGAMIVGPALAAPLFFVVGVRAALFLDALSFVVSWLCILLIGTVPAAAPVSAGTPSRPGFWRELWEGARYVAHVRTLRVLVVVGVIVLAAAGAFNALNVFFATENLGAPASAYGYLQAAAGIGLVLGAAGATVFANRIGPARMFWAGMLAVGVAVLVYARMTTLAEGITGMLLIGLLNAPIDAAVGPLLLQATPRALIGRVSALLGTAMSLASVTSVLVAGYLTSTVLAGVAVRIAGVTLNSVGILFSASGVVAVIGGLYAMNGLRTKKGVAPDLPPSDS